MSTLALSNSVIRRFTSFFFFQKRKANLATHFLDVHIVLVGFDSHKNKNKTENIFLNGSNENVTDADALFIILENLPAKLKTDHFAVWNVPVSHIHTHPNSTAMYSCPKCRQMQFCVHMQKKRPLF